MRPVADKMRREMAQRLHDETKLGVIECFKVLKDAHYVYDKAVELANNWHKTKVV